MAHLRLPLVVVVIITAAPLDSKKLRGSTAKTARMTKKDNDRTTKMWEID